MNRYYLKRIFSSLFCHRRRRRQQQQWPPSGVTEKDKAQGVPLVSPPQQSGIPAPWSLCIFYWRLLGFIFFFFDTEQRP
ncbi:hypothetical protein V6N13_097269 [Hibiscus sabdariffa]|uniref:Uncharacterized protein n=1 Tax=Hibiscus sabdariffa TaxID=183260 RepID=A0ABR2ABB0_9ROSI